MVTNMKIKKDFEIKFGQSRSGNYDKAIILAKKFSDFMPIGKKATENVIKTDIVELYNKRYTFDKLYKIIGGWRSTSVEHKGEEVIRPRMYIDRTNTIAHCYIEYDRSTSKKSYCCTDKNNKSGWGCRIINNLGKDLTDFSHYEYWYDFGHFESIKRWIIDKGEIRERLNKEANVSMAHHCNNFSIDRVLKQVDELPDYIDLDGNNDWKIEYDSYYDMGGTIKKRPTGIIYALRPEGCAGAFDDSNISIRFSGMDFDDDDGDSEKQEARTRYIPDVSFDDVGGIDPIVDQIREIIELPIKRPDIHAHLGIKPHKGILLYGSPGNGKTLIAKAIANEIKAHFIPIAGPELLSKWHGESEENLRKVFKEARELKPSIIFFDEIDAVAQSRSGDESNRIDAKFVNQLLTLMDGMESYDGVTILAATNRPELIDGALLRPGRFDYKIEIKNPDGIGCYKILKIATKKMPLDGSVDIYKIAPMLVGFSGAEIASVAKMAAMGALRRSVDVRDIISGNSDAGVDVENIKVIYDDFIKAIDELRENMLDKDTQTGFMITNQ